MRTLLTRPLARALARFLDWATGTPTVIPGSETPDRFQSHRGTR